MDVDLSELLFNGLNEQGYLFQEACAQVLLKNQKRTGWQFSVLDYPVALPNGNNTRVDFVLSRPEFSFWLFGVPDYGLPQEFHGVILPSSGSSSHMPATSYKSPIDMGSQVAMSWMEVRRNREEVVTKQRAFGKITICWV